MSSVESSDLTSDYYGIVDELRALPDGNAKDSLADVCEIAAIEIELLRGVIDANRDKVARLEDALGLCKAVISTRQLIGDDGHDFDAALQRIAEAGR